MLPITRIYPFFPLYLESNEDSAVIDEASFKPHWDKILSIFSPCLFDSPLMFLAAKLVGALVDRAEFLHKNPDYKVLFDASRKVKKEDIEFVKQMLDRFSN